MTIFVVLASLLSIAVLVLVLWPLWYRSRGLSLGIATLALATTFALYHLVGTPAALDAKAIATPTTLADAVTQLEAELERDPGQVEGWRLLGQGYTTEQRFEDASAA